MKNPTKKLGKLQEVDLRDYWKNEALDFTQWLSEPENMEQLSDEIGIGIQVLEREASVGRFAVDILGEEENTGRKIIIENQLEATDHTHLGQIITYTAGLEASFVIWIVREAREEHIQAIEWLNEHTDEEIHFFLVVLKLWQIGDSDPAPKFDVVCRPNDWKRSMKALTDGSLSETKERQLAFWQRFKDFISEKFPRIKFRKPQPAHWYDIGIGRPDCYISLITDSRENLVRCELYIPQSKDLFKQLEEHQEKIEADLKVPEKVEWLELPARKASRIRVVRPFVFEDETTWQEAIVWLVDTFTKFKQTFSKDWS